MAASVDRDEFVADMEAIGRAPSPRRAVREDWSEGWPIKFNRHSLRP